eukprot:5389877-Prorocentrum_lima.AAC.1
MFLLSTGLFSEARASMRRCVRPHCLARVVWLPRHALAVLPRWRALFVSLRWRPLLVSPQWRALCVSPRWRALLVPPQWRARF